MNYWAGATTCHGFFQSEITLKLELLYDPPLDFDLI